MAERDQLEVAERDLMRLVRQAGLPEPDEVNYREWEGEVELVWREQKLVVVVECEAP